MKTINWGILGSANIAGNQFIPGLHLAEGNQLQAVASRTKEKAEAFAQKHGIPKAYGSYDELLNDPNVDAVYIALPNHLHVEWSLKAMEKGKHVLCEKPLALKSEDVKKVKEYSDTYNVCFMEAFMYQFHPQWKRAIDCIKSGLIGDIRIIRSQFSFPLGDRSNIRLNPEMGGGSLYDVGCYCVHSSHLLVNQEPEKVQAIAHFNENQVETSLSGLIQYPNGVLVHFDSSFEATDRQYVEITGFKGSLQIPFPFRPDKGEPKIIYQGVEGYWEERVEDTNIYREEILYFSNCIRENKNPTEHLERTYTVSKIIESLYLALD